MQDERVKVSALKVVHGLLENCFAFKFETENKKVVFSGDTIFFPPPIDFAKDADVLVHEVMLKSCLLYTSPSPRDTIRSRMPSSA